MIMETSQIIMETMRMAGVGGTIWITGGTIRMTGETFWRIVGRVWLIERMIQVDAEAVEIADDGRWPLAEGAMVGTGGAVAADDMRGGFQEPPRQAARTRKVAGGEDHRALHPRKVAGGEDRRALHPRK